MSRKIEVLFPDVTSYRTNSRIEALIEYWISLDDGVGRNFASKSHFIRSAIIVFDRVLRSNPESVREASSNDGALGDES